MSHKPESDGLTQRGADQPDTVSYHVHLCALTTSGRERLTPAIGRRRGVSQSKVFGSTQFHLEPIESHGRTVRDHPVVREHLPMDGAAARVSPPL
jgi:hypothetical protein